MQARTLLLSCLILLAATFRPASSGCLSANENDDITASSETDRVNLYTGEQTFSLSLLAAINQAVPTENIFFSPYSTYSVLLLTYFSARKEAEASLKNVLHLSWSQSKMQVFQAFRSEKRVQAARSANSSIEFVTADKMFVAQQIPIRECMQNLFNEELEMKDFASAPEQSAMEINQWIEQVTRGMLKDVIPPDLIRPDTKLALANAAYFRGNWDKPFREALTKQENFYTSPNKPRTVTMMNMKEPFRYAFNEQLGAEILQIPYEGDDKHISMVIFLPPLAENSIEQMLGKMTAESLRQALNEGTMYEIELKLPKFSFEQSFDFEPILQKIGAGAIFGSAADFSGLAENVSFNLNAAIHKAHIDVYEKGSKAAAATIVETFKFRIIYTHQAQFFCDRPFLFMIYDRSSQAVLFTGVYREPTLVE